MFVIYHFTLYSKKNFFHHINYAAFFASEAIQKTDCILLFVILSWGGK